MDESNAYCPSLQARHNKHGKIFLQKTTYNVQNNEEKIKTRQ